MQKVNKIVGFSALYQGLAYLAGILFFTLVIPYATVADELGRLELLLNKKGLVQLVYGLIYTVFGFVLILLTQSICKKAQNRDALLVPFFTVVGYVWAAFLIASGFIFISGLNTVAGLMGQSPQQALQFWQPINLITEALGGGNELLGGIWLLSVTEMARKRNWWPKWFNYIGFLSGAAAVFSILPILSELLSALFGLGQMIWFFLVGFYLISSNK